MGAQHGQRQYPRKTPGTPRTCVVVVADGDVVHVGDESALKVHKLLGVVLEHGLAQAQQLGQARTAGYAVEVQRVPAQGA